MKKPRHLSPEERALWEEVAKRTERIDRPAPAPKPPAKKPNPTIPRPHVTPMDRTFRVGQNVDHHRDHNLVAGLSRQLAAAPVNMDRKSFTRLKRGKLKPEGRIDLHGMTLAQAHPALMSFVLGAHQNGKRLVLVITGKGKSRDQGGPIPTRLGVLRHQVPQWLAMPPLSQAVLQVTEAHISHGGHGAYYVYLKRIR